MLKTSILKVIRTSKTQGYQKASGSLCLIFVMGSDATSMARCCCAGRQLQYWHWHHRNAQSSGADVILKCAATAVFDTYVQSSLTIWQPAVVHVAVPAFNPVQARLETSCKHTSRSSVWYPW